MSIDPNPIEIMILRILMTQSSPLFAGSITEKYGLSYRDLVRTLKDMEQDGLVSVNGAIVSVTRLGRKWALENQTKFRNQELRAYSETPDKYISAKRQSHTPYAPRLSKLDKQFFSLHARDDD